MLRLVLTVVLPIAAYGCGVPTYHPNTRVVNGEDAGPYSWPWQVSLQFLIRGGRYQHTCGGSLIAPSWVITAAHCIHYDYTYRIVLGEHDLSLEEGAEQYILINNNDLFVHPQWDEGCVQCGHDIALIKLSREAQLNDKVQLGCIPPRGELLSHNQLCYVTGWGLLTSSGPSPDILQQADLPVVGISICTQSDWWGKINEEYLVCAGAAGKAACSSDSGGPLNCKSSDGRWFVYGVTSFGPGACNLPKKPTVFSRVSAHNDWIQEVMDKN
ncbi:proproteinase E [Xenopus laevis]|uniref:Proproteinase E n=2 Tax=Xenopus laevis TaxID=8355 RepID=A0A8J1LA22_XENLA|nr:proproteinase E [Xenopus laevis]